MRGKTPRKAVEAEDGGYRENGEGEAKGHFAKPAKGIQQRKKVLADWRLGVRRKIWVPYAEEQFWRVLGKHPIGVCRSGEQQIDMFVQVYGARREGGDANQHNRCEQQIVPHELPPL